MSPRRLTDQQLSRLLPLLDLADTVELKVTVPEARQRSAVAALDLDPLAAQLRQVHFLDTPDLRLHKAGVVVRTRRIAGRPGDAVVKLRPVGPKLLTPKLRGMPGFGVEVDAMPGGFVCSARLKAKPKADVREVLGGGGPLSTLFTKAQRALYAEHAPEDVALDDLTALGPIFVLKLRATPPGLGRPLVAELWLYADDSRLLELSAKSAPHEAFDLAARLRVLMADRGVEVAARPETKTRRALELLAG